MNVNEKGFVNFKTKKWNFAGDKGTFVKIKEENNKKIMTIKKAAKGTISSEFANELQEFCNHFGIDFKVMKFGETLSKEI